jgi:hypothetical protein
MTSAELFAKADDLDKQVQELRRQGSEARLAELKARSLADRLVYSATARCPCGAGLAYDPAYEDESSVFRGPLSGHWDCSAILLGTADPAVQHTDQLPFAFYEIKTEGQPSACGATTRVPSDLHARAVAAIQGIAADEPGEESSGPTKNHRGETMLRNPPGPPDPPKPARRNEWG